MTNPDDLNQLIDNANAEVETTIQNAERAKPKRKDKGRFKPLLPLAIALLALFVYSTQQQKTPDSAVVAAQLSDLLRQARESVEAGTVNGQLPTALPNAALGAVVNYSRFPGGYFLSVQSRGVAAEMDNSGKISVSGAN